MLTNNEWNKRFSENLNRIMKDRGISLNGLSELTGMSKSVIHSYMHGTITPKGYAAYQLVERLGCTFDDLMGTGESQNVISSNAAPYFNIGECYVFNYIENRKHMHRPGILRAMIPVGDVMYGLFADYEGNYRAIELDRDNVKSCKGDWYSRKGNAIFLRRNEIYE